MIRPPILMARVACALLLLMTSAAAAPSVCAQAAAEKPLEGRPVVAIRVVTEEGQTFGGNLPQLPQKAGQPYSTEAVAESLRILLKTGNFADVRAETADTPDGLRLDFIVQHNYFYNIVRIEGLIEPPGEQRAMVALRLNAGLPFRPRDVDQALNRLKSVLRDEGFYEAKVSYDLDPVPATHQMNIRVKVVPGLRARIGAVEVKAPADPSAAELRRRSKLKEGQEVTSERLDNGINRLRKYLVKQRYLGARITVRRGEYDSVTKRLPLELDVSTGPKVRVEVSGARISQKQLRSLLPIYEEQAVDQDLLQEGRQVLRDHLEGQGYFDSTVTYTQKEEPGKDGEPTEQVIVYEVARGPKLRLAGIGFEGNATFNDELLMSRLKLVPAAFLSRGRFSRNLMEDGADSIHSMYVANGFREVTVASELIEKYQGKDDALFVRYKIQEGPQTLIATLKIEGNQTLTSDEILAYINFPAGQAYSESFASGDREQVLALYYDEGFPFVQVQVEVSPAAEPNRVNLTYRITEGQRMIVKEILYDGQEHTRTGVIRRQTNVEPGGALQESKVIETQRQLYDLGIFNRVVVAPQNPAGSDPEKTVVVLVDEARRYTISYGGGFEVQTIGGSSDNPAGRDISASPRIIFEFTKANMTGRAQTFSFKMRASTLQGRALATYTIPRFFAGPNFSLLISAYGEKSRDVRTFTVERYEGSLQLAQKVNKTTSLLYRYSFRRVSVGDLRIDPDEVPLFNQPTLISALGITWARDSRRDNPVDATRGTFNTIDYGISLKTIGSAANFGRFYFQNSTYHPIGRRLNFARSVRFGVEDPLRGTIADEIPLPERFFAGGGGSLRGFALNQAGPRDPQTGFPVGGLALLVFNNELRFPMYIPWVSERLGGKLGGAVFYDAGNVFSRFNRITFRIKPQSPDDLNFFSHTIGFSFRYGTPIGPVRLDLSLLLNPAQFTFNDSLGNPQVGRLPRFHFFFNIGSLF